MNICDKIGEVVLHLFTGVDGHIGLTQNFFRQYEKALIKQAKFYQAWYGSGRHGIVVGAVQQHFSFAKYS